MGVAQDFKAFVQRQQVKAAEERTIDWIAEKQEWLDYLDKLYADIEIYLNEYIEAGAISLKRSHIELNEENIGTYNAPRLFIDIGPQQISLTPVGTLLIGTKGRVDVEGSSGSARLLLADRSAVSPRFVSRVSVVREDGPETTSARSSSEEPPFPAVDWVWKIATKPPVIKFIDLTKETLFEMLMEVSNG
ncbi:MAG TPA: hypothetical protein VE079_04225 [Ensifer sp.]|nr:hypothetical protein [Ensifer sp.]